MTWTVLSPAIETPYISPDHDHFVVSLVLGLPERDGIRSPEEALRRALHDVYARADGADHIWCIWDRSTGERHLRQARDILGCSPSLLAQVVAGGENEPSGGEQPSPDHGPSKDWLIARAWGDIEADMSVLEEALRLAMQATTDAFHVWERDGEGERRFGDEFSLGPEQVAALSTEWRLAYVARLLRSVAGMYGMTTEWNAAGIGAVETSRDTVARVVRQLMDVVDRHRERTSPDAA